MRKKVMFFGIFFVLFLMISTSTALSVCNSKTIINKIEQLKEDQSFLKLFFKIKPKGTVLAGVLFLAGLILWIPALIIGIPLGVISGAIGFFLMFIAAGLEVLGAVFPPLIAFVEALFGPIILPLIALSGYSILYSLLFPLVLYFYGLSL